MGPGSSGPGPAPSPIHRATFQIPLLHVFIRFYAFMGSLEKDARRKTMQVGVLKISPSLTATRLVTKSVMSIRRQKPSIMEPCQSPNSSLTHPHAQHLIAIPAPRCGGIIRRPPLGSGRVRVFLAKLLRFTPSTPPPTPPQAPGSCLLVEGRVKHLC